MAKKTKKSRAHAQPAYTLVAPEPPSDEVETDIRWEAVCRANDNNNNSSNNNNNNNNNNGGSVVDGGGGSDAKAPFLTGKHTAATHDVFRLQHYDYTATSAAFTHATTTSVVGGAAQQQSQQQIHETTRASASLLPPLPPPASPARAAAAAPQATHTSSTTSLSVSSTSTSLPAATATTTSSTSVATAGPHARTPSLPSARPPAAVDVYVAAERALVDARATTREAADALRDMTELHAAETDAAARTRAQLQRELAQQLQQLTRMRDGDAAAALTRATTRVCVDQQHHLAHVLDLLAQDEQHERAFNERAASHEKCARVTAAYFREHSQHVTKMERLQAETAEMHERMLAGMTQTLQRTAEELTWAFARGPTTNAAAATLAEQDATATTTATSRARARLQRVSTVSSSSSSSNSSSEGEDGGADDAALLVRELVWLERQSAQCIGQRDATQRSIAALRRQIDVEAQRLLLARARQAQLQRQVQTLTARVQHAEEEQQQRQQRHHQMLSVSSSSTQHDVAGDVRGSSGSSSISGNNNDTAVVAAGGVDGGDGAAVLAREARQLQEVTHELQTLSAQLQQLQLQRMQQLRGDNVAVDDATMQATVTGCPRATTTTRTVTASSSNNNSAAAAAAEQQASPSPPQQPQQQQRVGTSLPPAQQLDADTRARLRMAVAQALCDVDALLQSSCRRDTKNNNNNNDNVDDGSGVVAVAQRDDAAHAPATTLSRLFALSSFAERKAVQNYVARKVDHVLTHQYPGLTAHDAPRVHTFALRQQQQPCA